MHITICLVLLSFWNDGTGSLTRIAKENGIKKAAEEAFLNKDYKTAIQNFTYLMDSLKVSDENAVLNLAHSYYRLNDLSTASKTYERLYNSKNLQIRSIAAQQLGVLSFKGDQDKEKALTFFKDALRANPDNAEARYNYEFLKKLQKGKEDPKMDNKNKDDKKDDKKEGDQKDQQNGDKGDKKEDKGKEGGKKDQDKDGKGDKKDDKGKEGDKNDKGDKKDQNGKDGKGDKSDNKDNKKNGKEKEGGEKDKEENEKANKDKNGENTQGKDDKKQGGKEGEQGNAMKEKQGGKKEKEKMVANPEVLAKMGMTDARAKMILDAMKSSEVQYIQQQKREPAKKQKRGKPDW